MRVYRVYNQTEGRPAAGLYFLKSADAEKYKDLVRWPYVDGGVWPLPDGGEIPLAKLDLRVESLELPVSVEKSSQCVVMVRTGDLGSAPLLTGDCFDPRQWLAFTPEELAHPVRGPLLAEAGRTLWGSPPSGH